MTDFISPLDGRYSSELNQIRELGFSERKLIQSKLKVECEWLKWIVKLGLTPPVDYEHLEECLEAVPEKYVNTAVSHNAVINHDTKAVELAIKEALRECSISSICEFVHFGLTSEDVSNMAYALMFISVWDQVLVPNALELISVLEDLTRKYALNPMLGLTHGQAASPTTFGKEEGVFLYRLKSEKFCSPKAIRVKFGGGATGNFSALAVAYPSIDWVEESTKFVESFNSRLKHDSLTTQISNRESIAEHLHLLTRVNTILLDLCQDHWLYCSRNLLKLKLIREEVGSSTMPHKVNPIQFENAEGNLEIANNLNLFLASKFCKSRMQRDLSDSTVWRNLGVGIGHTLVAWKAILAGLDRIHFDQESSNAELMGHWEILAEPAQTILRKYPNVKDPYGLLKDFTRKGERLGQEAYTSFVTNVCRPIVDEADYDRLIKLTPHTYLGIAPELAIQAANLSVY